MKQNVGGLIKGFRVMPLDDSSPEKATNVQIYEYIFPDIMKPRLHEYARGAHANCPAVLSFPVVSIRSEIRHWQTWGRANCCSLRLLKKSCFIPFKQQVPCENTNWVHMCSGTQEPLDVLSNFAEMNEAAIKVNARLLIVELNIVDLSYSDGACTSHRSGRHHQTFCHCNTTVLFERDL